MVDVTQGHPVDLSPIENMCHMLKGNGACNVTCALGDSARNNAKHPCGPEGRVLFFSAPPTRAAPDSSMAKSCASTVTYGLWRTHIFAYFAIYVPRHSTCFSTFTASRPLEDRFVHGVAILR